MRLTHLPYNLDENCSRCLLPAPSPSLPNLECEEDRSQDDKDDSDAPDGKQDDLPLPDLSLALVLDVLEILQIPDIKDGVASFCSRTCHCFKSQNQLGHFEFS